MPVTIHFLLVYSYSDQRLLRSDEYGNADEAAAAYREAERQYQGRSDEFEVVLVGADSLSTVMKTHGHYFTSNAEETLSALVRG